MDPAATSQLTNITEMIGIHNDGFLDLRELINIIRPIRVKGPVKGPLRCIKRYTEAPRRRGCILGHQRPTLQR